MTDKQEPVAYLVEGWHDGKLLAHIPHLSLDQAKDTAAVFSQHYTATVTRPLYAAPPAQPARPLTLVQATAPREIWLQVSDEEGDNGEPFPNDTEDITWCQNSALMCEVKYVRTDLAAQPAPAQRLSDELIRDAWRQAESLETVVLRQKYWPKLKEFARAIEAAIVPPGYVVVPVEPTPEMITAGTVALMKASDSDLDATREEIAATYRAMIAAAPKGQS